MFLKFSTWMMSLTSPIKPHMIHSMRLVKICFFEIFFQMISSLTFFYFSESHNKTYSTCIISYRSYIWPSLEAQLVKNPPVRQETWVQSLGWEDPLKKGKATHSSIWAWRIPRTVYIYIYKSRTQLSDFHRLFKIPNIQIYSILWRQ